MTKYKFCSPTSKDQDTSSAGNTYLYCTDTRRVSQIESGADANLPVIGSGLMLEFLCSISKSHFLLKVGQSVEVPLETCIRFLEGELSSSKLRGPEALLHLEKGTAEMMVMYDMDFLKDVHSKIQGERESSEIDAYLKSVPVMIRNNLAKTYKLPEESWQLRQTNGFRIWKGLVPP